MGQCGDTAAAREGKCVANVLLLCGDTAAAREGKCVANVLPMC
jgi:hypothetical protein